MKKTVFLLLLLLTFTFPVHAARVAEEDAVMKTVKQGKASVVSILTITTEGREGGGSGIIISRDGFILTNAHVVANGKTIQVGLCNGKKFSAVIVGMAKDKDLAVIKVKASNLSVPKFGNSSSLQLGQSAIAIGNPLKFTWSVTVGVISALNRDIKTKGIMYRDLIQTDAAINPGSSGGALFNTKGEVIGVNTLVYTGNSDYRNAQGLSFAIPINSALQTAKYLRKGEVQSSPSPWIGISAVTITQEMAENYDLPVKRGLLVDNVVSYGPSKKAGVKKGDIITEFNGQRVFSVGDFKSLLTSALPGQIIELTVWQSGKKIKLNVTVEHQSQ